MYGPEVQRIAEGAVQISWPAVIDVSIHALVMELDQHIQHNPFPGWIENVPAYHSLTIYFDPLQVPPNIDFFLQSTREPTQPINSRIVRIPVCYDGILAPDLHQVTEQLNLTTEELIDLHTSKYYHVFMIGFLPGFPYLGILPEKLVLPRKKAPSLSIPQGAVAIAGMQTGIYPVSSPGGWHVVGLTPYPMFREGSTLLQPGDQVQFYSIGMDTFHQLKKQFLVEWPSI